MRRSRILGLAVLAALLATGTAGALSVEHEMIRQKHPVCCPDEQNCFEIILFYPEFSPSSKVGAKLGKEVGLMLLGPLPGKKKRHPNFAALFEELTRPFETWCSKTRVGEFAIERRVEVIHESSQVISLSMEQSIENAGEPASRATHLASFNASGRLVSHADLFVSGYKPVLQEIVAERLRDEFEVSNPQVTNNFAVVETGLRFYYNRGELGATSIDLVVDLERLQKLIRPDGPFAVGD